MPDVAIDLIKQSPYQPRLFFEVDDLKEEIERDGLLSALVVRKKDEYYELLDGERRLRTLKELGWKRVPVDVRDVDDTTAKRSVFKLNLVRQNTSDRCYNKNRCWLTRRHRNSLSPKRPVVAGLFIALKL